MRYEHSAARSAELLRLALKKMIRQDAGLHPVSYAVWYEYVAGSNLALQVDIDALLSRKIRLDDATTQALYDKHIADPDTRTALKIGTGVSLLAGQISESVTVAGDHASRFGDRLENWKTSLTQPTSAVDLLTKGVRDILAGTAEMQDAIATLQTRLEESALEAQHLRLEVARAREEALIDALTGLTNRKGFDLALAASLAAAKPEIPGPCLLMIDLDHFKAVNDSRGHLFGDRVLRDVGQILRANVKGQDTAARFGGEEFALILPRTPRGGALGLAEALRAIIHASEFRQNKDLGTPAGSISVSIGVADYLAGESAKDLIARADQALYTAKSQGRNRVSLAPQQPFERQGAVQPLG